LLLALTQCMTSADDALSWTMQPTCLLSKCPVLLSYALPCPCCPPPPQANLQDLEDEEASLDEELASLKLEFAALHQNTSFMEQQLETQQVLMYALTGRRQVRRLGHEIGRVLHQQAHNIAQRDSVQGCGRPSFLQQPTTAAQTL
jgi:hypothetical protein